jgi:hypothetical protein
MSSYKRLSGVLCALSIVLLAANFSQAAVGDTIRVNAGGGDYVDVAGRTWVADAASTGGTVYTNTNDIIAGTNDQELFQTEMWADTDAGPFFYSFVVPPGTFTVRMYFAEIYNTWCNVGNRVFNVAINGSQVLGNFDIFAEVGCTTAVTKQFSVTTVTGNIQIDFTNVGSGHPKINAIEIFRVPGSSLYNKPSGNHAKLLISSANGGLFVQAQTEGAYTLELSDLQGKRMGQKHGFGPEIQSFTNLNPGLYFLTSRIGQQAVTRTVSVVR